MSAAEASGELTKSAKKRMAKKAKEAAAAHAAEEEAVAASPPVPEPKAKGKAKAKAETTVPPKAAVAPKVAATPKVAAAAPKAAVAPKAASEPAKPAAKGKAKAKAEPEPKAAAKGAAKAAVKAEPKAQAKSEPKATPKVEPKPKASGKAKSKAVAKPAEEAPPVKRDELPINTFLDDGTGGAWETTANTKKQKKPKDKVDPTDVGKAEEKGQTVSTKAKAAPGAPIGREAAKAKAHENAAAEVARILAMKSAEPEIPVATAHCDSIIVPEPKIGIVIGPKGTTIQTIQEKTKVTRIDTSGGVFTITGEEEAVKEAKAAIQDIIDKGFCTLFYEEFAEGFVNAHPVYFPDIIGSRGSTINEIKKNLKVEITIPTLPTERHAEQKFKIKIAGDAKQVEEAKEVINSIMMYQHHEITHPGQVHQELEVEQWAYSFIIGRGGSEMKHIQKNWEVKVVIPREHSLNQNVLIVGVPENVERAKAYVEKLLFQAENAKANPREKVEDAVDKWADKDDEVEPGLQGYLYQRS